jgi:hypothetical protein
MPLPLEIPPDQLGLLQVVFGDQDPRWHTDNVAEVDENPMKIG